MLTWIKGCEPVIDLFCWKLYKWMCFSRESVEQKAQLHLGHTRPLRKRSASKAQKQSEKKVQELPGQCYTLNPSLVGTAKHKSTKSIKHRWESFKRRESLGLKAFGWLPKVAWYVRRHLESTSDRIKINCLKSGFMHGSWVEIMKSPILWCNSVLPSWVRDKVATLYFPFCSKSHFKPVAKHKNWEHSLSLSKVL